MEKQNKRDISVENAPRRKKSRRSRRRGKNENAPKRVFPWKKALIIAGILAVVLVVLAIIFGSEPTVYHQMPKVTPPETVEIAEGGV